MKSETESETVNGKAKSVKWNVILHRLINIDINVTNTVVFQSVVKATKNELNMGNETSGTAKKNSKQIRQEEGTKTSRTL